MNSPQHTPLPWDKPVKEERSLWNSNIGMIFLKEDAEFIVKACNMHYELVEALKEAQAGLEFAGAKRASFYKDAFIPAPSSAYEIVSQALAKATGGQE